jgi:ADP-L-glycero-D-manno-heptose 6-epimerase
VTAVKYCASGKFRLLFVEPMLEHGPKENTMIVVTGAAGFIGSATIWALNARGREDILAVDSLGADDRWRNLRGLNFVDYMEKRHFLRLVEAGCPPGDITAMIHLGACSDTTERDAAYLVSNNFEYTKTLMEHAVERQIRFIYASSAATYGDGSHGYVDDEADLDSLRPLNMYGYSKHMVDCWARRRGLLDRVVSLKYFNVFGPNEYHKGEMRSVVIKAYEQIQASGVIRLFRSHRPDFDDGEQKRDFLYVKDAVAMTLHFLERPAVNGIFNIGSGRARTWNDLAQAIFTALERPARIEYFDMPEELRDRYQYYTQADLTRFKQTGYRQPITGLEEAVGDYVRNYLTDGAYLADL